MGRALGKLLLGALVALPLSCGESEVDAEPKPGGADGGVDARVQKDAHSDVGLDAVFGDASEAETGTDSSVADSAADAGACPPASVCHIVDGLVIAPVPGADQYFYDWKVPPGSYSRLHASVRVFHGGWSPDPTAVRYAVLYLERSKPFDMFAHTMFVRSNNVLLRHGFGLKPVDKAKLTAKASLTKGEWYDLDYVFDTKAQSIVLEVRNAGSIVATIKDAPNIATIEFKATDRLGMFLGFVAGDNPQEGASNGWQYWDLKVVLTP